MGEIKDISELLFEQEIAKAVEVPKELLYPVIISNFTTAIGELMRPIQRMAREMANTFTKYQKVFDRIGYLMDIEDTEKAGKILSGFMYYYHTQEGKYKRRKCHMRRK